MVKELDLKSSAILVQEFESPSCRHFCTDDRVVKVIVLRSILIKRREFDPHSVQLKSSILLMVRNNIKN